MMQAAFLLLILCDIRAVPSTHVDLIEINHLHDESGKHKSTQIILWDWSPDYRRYQVRAWWIPERLHDELSGLTITKRDRTIVGRAVRETWTDYDPEVENRKVFPCHLRRGL